MLRPPQREKNKNFVYDGEWQGDKPYGTGSIIFGNGEYFEGEFTDGKATGVGRYVFSNGDVYEGDISDNAAEGNGRFVGSKFEFVGTWEKSRPKVGVYRIRDTGTIIEMENENEGTIRWANGESYKG